MINIPQALKCRANRARLVFTISLCVCVCVCVYVCMTYCVGLWVKDSCGEVKLEEL